MVHAYTFSRMVRFAIVLSSLFALLSAVALALLGVTFTKTQLQRYPILRHLPQKRVLLLVIAVIFLSASFGANTWKEFLLAPNSPVFDASSHDIISRSATLSDFEREARDIASERAIESAAYFEAGTRDVLAERYVDATLNFEKSVELMPTMSGFLNVGIGYQVTGSLERGRQAHEEGLRIARRKNDEKFIGSFLGMLGEFALLQGRIAEAEGSLKAALDISMKYEDKSEIAFNRHQLGDLYKRQKHYAKALQLYRSSLEVEMHHDSPTFRAKMLLDVASISVEQGKFDEAISQLETALALYRSRGDTKGEAAVLMRLSEACQKKGALDKVLSYAISAVNFVKKRDDPLRASLTWRIIGSIYIDQKKYEEALRALRITLEIQDQLQDLTWKAGTLTMISGVYREQGDFRKAIDHLKMAREIYMKVGESAAALRTELDREIFWLHFYEGLSRTRKEQ